MRLLYLNLLKALNSRLNKIKKPKNNLSANKIIDNKKSIST